MFKPVRAKLARGIILVFLSLAVTACSSRQDSVRSQQPTDVVATSANPLARAGNAAAAAEAAGAPPAVVAPAPLQEPGLESFNRIMFKNNMRLDRGIIKPAAKGYGAAVPEGVRIAFRNLFGNLVEPYYFINHNLQTNFDYAGISVLRFGINSTLGLAGLFDVAGAFGLTRRDTDIGITLGVWGVGMGPYLQIPLFGPSNPRDLVSTAAGFFTNPLGYVNGIPWYASASMTTVKILDVRQQLIAPMDALEANSFDFYSVVRSAYLQQRQNSVKRAKEHKLFDFSQAAGGGYGRGFGGGPPGGGPPGGGPASGRPAAAAGISATPPQAESPPAAKSPGGDYDWGAEDTTAAPAK
ncbi:MAG: VacJ family lipoprotein [Candidatus Pacebacteria bacterium]|nr:VacJ family lipoprotein [Candidatus Paceibacterota bacterium]